MGHLSYALEKFNKTTYVACHLNFLHHAITYKDFAGATHFSSLRKPACSFETDWYFANREDTVGINLKHVSIREKPNNCPEDVSISPNNPRQ